MKNKVNKTNTDKANFVLGVVVFLFLISSILFVFSGLKTGEMKTKIIQPLNTFFTSLSKMISEVAKDKNTPQIRSTSTVIINNQTSVNESSTSSVRIIQNGKTIQSIDSTNTSSITPNPTFVEFKQNIETQIKTKNAESLKVFCSQMPNSPVCK